LVEKGNPKGCEKQKKKRERSKKKKNREENPYKE